MIGDDKKKPTINAQRKDRTIAKKDKNIPRKEDKRAQTEER